MHVIIITHYYLLTLATVISTFPLRMLCSFLPLYMLTYLFHVQIIMCRIFKKSGPHFSRPFCLLQCSFEWLKEKKK